MVPVGLVLEMEKQEKKNSPNSQRQLRAVFKRQRKGVGKVLPRMGGVWGGGEFGSQRKFTSCQHVDVVCLCCVCTPVFPVPPLSPTLSPTPGPNPRPTPGPTPGLAMMPVLPSPLGPVTSTIHTLRCTAVFLRRSPPCPTNASTPMTPHG